MGSGLSVSDRLSDVLRNSCRYLRRRAGRIAGRWSALSNDRKSVVLAVCLVALIVALDVVPVG
jgi:hypothetical protein